MLIDVDNNISVLIRTYNSAKTLYRLLDALMLKHGDECIIVDSGSSDGTLRIAEAYGARIIKAPPPFHYSKSLNLGFAAAKNSWVLVISSHCIPQVPNFLEIYRHEILKFSKEVIVGYGPSTLSGKNDPNLEQIETCIFTANDYERVSRICSNANTIYRKQAWEELPFNEQIRTAEDKIWITEMVAKGYHFAYIPLARGININKGSLLYMFKKGYRDKRSTREKDFRPMGFYHLAGGFKNLTLSFLKKEVDIGNYVRSNAQLLGQFFGSHQKEDNTPVRGGS